VADVPDSRYLLPTIQASTLAGLLDYAAERKRDPAAWFEGAAISARQCADPDARLSFRDVALVLRRALRDFPGTGLGLAAGSRVTLPALGLLGFSMMSSPTMGEAAAVGAKYHPVSGSLMDSRARVIDGEFVLEAVERFPEPEILRFLCEKFFASAVAVSRALLGPQYRPLRLELGYPAPAYADEYRQLFRCPIAFGAGRNRLYADPAILSRKIPTHSPSSHAEALRLCDSRMPADAGLIESLQAWLRPRLGSAPRIAEAAHDLRLGERTLRRRLGAAGTSFRAIHDALRAERAKVLLRDPRLGIAEIARALGFSEDREFRRAYKRWTGSPPSAARP
jgi:AraC-like DNA-binding protein